MSQEEKKYRIVFSSTGLADRIALYVSHEAMKKLGWSSKPELLLEVFRQDLWSPDPLRRHYLGEYNDRGSRYLTEVTLQRDDKTQKWSRGYVRMGHLSGKWVFYAAFIINRDPEVGSASFEQMEPTKHVPAKVFEQEVWNLHFEFEDEQWKQTPQSEPDFHCPRCDQGIHGNPKLCEKCGIELR